MKIKKPPISLRFILASTVVLVATAVVWGLLSPPTQTASTTSPANSDPGMPSTPAAAVRAIVAPDGNRALRRTTIAEGADIPKRQPRSPLERSPGYFPPDDPESMSVITGRREAPAVDLELAGGAPSIDGLGRQLVAGINARDEAAIHSLGVTRQEFEVILWREFPESRPVTHITAADAWEMSGIQAHAGVSRAVGGFGYRNLEFIRVDSGPPVPFRNFNLYREVEIVTRDPSTAREVRLGFAPSFVERHGRFKVLAFKD